MNLEQFRSHHVDLLWCRSVVKDNHPVQVRQGPHHIIPRLPAVNRSLPHQVWVSWIRVYCLRKPVLDSGICPTNTGQCPLVALGASQITRILENRGAKSVRLPGFGVFLDDLVEKTQNAVAIPGHQTLTNHFPFSRGFVTRT